MLDVIQRALDFEGYRNPQFSRTDGLGRVGVAGFVTGLVFGVHLSILGCCLLINGLVLSRLVSAVPALTECNELAICVKGLYYAVTVDDYEGVGEVGRMRLPLG